MSTITWQQFEQVDLRVGTIIDVQDFPEAKKPALKLIIDLGSEIGIKYSSAQITHHYDASKLIGKQVLCVCNFPPKQIGPFISEVLTTGVEDEQKNIVLISPDKNVPNGSRLF